MTPRTEPAQPMTDQVAIHAIEPGAECWCGHPAAPPSEWKLAPGQEAAALSPEPFVGYIDEFGDERQHSEPTPLDVERLAQAMKNWMGRPPEWMVNVNGKDDEERARRSFHYAADAIAAEYARLSLEPSK